MKNLFKARWMTSLIFLILLFVITGIAAPGFLTYDNIITCFNTATMYTLLAVGIAFVIMTGEIDVSIGATLGLTAGMTGLIAQQGGSIPKMLLLCLVMALGLLVFGNIVHGWFIGKVPVMEQFSDLIIWMRTGGVLVALTILLSAMYAYMPNIKRPFWTQLPGASGAAISWAVLSYVISIYMTWG